MWRASSGTAKESSGARGWAVRKNPNVFLLRTALKDSPQGPTTANRHQPPTANCHQPPTANRHQLPTTKRR